MVTDAAKVTASEIRGSTAGSTEILSEELFTSGIAELPGGYLINLINVVVIRKTGYNGFNRANQEMNMNTGSCIRQIL
jgi:hypothetical protein